MNVIPNKECIYTSSCIINMHSLFGITLMNKYGKDSSFEFWRNKVACSIKECKRSYYKSRVSNLKTTNASKWWTEIKNLSGMADKNHHLFEHLIDGETIDSISTLCERINHFFVNLTTDLLSTIPLSQEEVFNYSAGDFDVAHEKSTVHNIP